MPVDLKPFLPLIISSVKVPRINIEILGQTFDIGPFIKQILPQLLERVLAGGADVREELEPGGEGPPTTGGGNRMTQITGFSLVEVMGMEGDRHGGNAGPQLSKNTVQQVGMRVHLNCSPIPDSGDPADPNLLRKGQGKSPKVTWRWGRYVNGKRVFNSKGGHGQLHAGQDEPDHWSLESYERKNDNDTSGPGLTPVLLLEEVFGPGTEKAFAFPCIEAAQNEGLDVEGPECTWQVD